MLHNVECLYCKKQESVYTSRFKNYKTCSIECSSKYKKSLSPNNAKCKQCNIEFHRKESHVKKANRHGVFCSRQCSSKFKSIEYSYKGNPNYKGVRRDWNGYYVDYCPTIGRKKLHHIVTFKELGITKIPKNYGVHHRDCDIDNNNPENLVLLSHSDHKWLHKQYGSAGLWAYYNNKITLENMIEWSNDKERAKRLVPLNLIEQKKSGVFKSDELLEKLEAVNQQLSLSMSGALKKKKSKVDKKVQRLESEDNSSNNLSTSVRHDLNHDDIV